MVFGVVNMTNILDFLEDEQVDDSINTFDWKNEWKNMPEFVQNKKEAYSKIIVRFNNEEDLQEFSKLIGQPLTNKTKSIWHPMLVRGYFSDLEYVDES